MSKLMQGHSVVGTCANGHDNRGGKATKSIKGFRKEFTKKAMLKLDLLDRMCSV